MKRTVLTLSGLLLVLLVTVTVKPFLFPSGMYESCSATLEAIDIAKQYWALENNHPRGTAVTLSDLYPRYLSERPQCPRNGTYGLGKIGEDPVCSIKNNPWHQRHYFLNYSREEFVAGKRVRFAGYARNTKGGPVVENGQESFPVQGLRSWSLLERNQKVTVFGVLSPGPVYAITNATYERGYFAGSSFAHCIAIAKQVEGAKASWALERHGSNDSVVQISELRQLDYFRGLPHCDSGGIYVVGRMDMRAICTLHGDILDDSKWR